MEALLAKQIIKESVLIVHHRTGSPDIEAKVHSWTGNIVVASVSSSVRS